jgi:hypothetical protein
MNWHTTIQRPRMKTNNLADSFRSVPMNRVAAEHPIVSRDNSSI